MNIDSFHNIIRKNYKPGINLNTSYLFYISALTVMAIIALQIFTNKEKVFCYYEMVKAAENMQIVVNEIHDFRTEKNIPIDPSLDPAQSGFIGEEFSPITTTLGNLESKQVAANPDFTALIVRWISELNLKPGSDIIIHASASFPALTIMSIVACETLEMNPVILTSVGASSYGANIPEFTYPDIENHLYKKGIIKHRSVMITPGGNRDNGSSLWEGGFENVIRTADQNKYTLFVPESLQESIEKKWQLCFDNRLPKLFINIGGNHSAFGTGECAFNFQTGKILSPLNCTDNNPGLIHKFNQAGIPVFHFLNIRDIAVKNGIGLSSINYLEKGHAEVYFTTSKPLVLVLISILIIFSMIVLLSKKI